jgi:hypothetical protein
LLSGLLEYRSGLEILFRIPALKRSGLHLQASAIILRSWDVFVQSSEIR